MPGHPWIQFDCYCNFHLLLPLMIVVLRMLVVNDQFQAKTFIYFML
jgi:hypothetical protein